jgi:3-oxoacyl-[acyl-carrier protein] reductase
MRLQGKRTVVTGGARGIGAAIARAYGAEGADVAIADVLDASVAEPVLAAVRAAGGRALFVPCDVTDEAQVRAAVERVESELGGIDVLVNDAGIVSQLAFEELTVAEYDRVMAVNLRGVFLWTRFAIPGMLARGSGVVINIASQLGQIGGVELVHYSASKAGVIGLTKALAREVATRGVRVNAIAPGPIETDMLKSETEEWHRRKLAELPIGRYGQVEEVAGTAVFLASDDGSYYVGQTLGPNGGDVML